MPECRNENVLVGTTSIIVAHDMPPSCKRKQIYICNTSPTQTVTIAKGSLDVENNAGFVLLPMGIYQESTDEGFICWQGAVQAISTAAGGSVAIVEDWE